MNWLVLYTKPRNEKKVAERLAKDSYEVYCPLIETIRQWSDRRKKVKVPLFTSYVFIKCGELAREKVLQDPGVLNFVYWLGKPAIVRDEEIEAIRHITTEAEDVQVSSLQLEKGQFVEIKEGPFRGLQGRVDQVNRTNFVLYIEPLDCQVQFKYSKRFVH